jgi:UDP-galactopyranose mutase
MSLFEGADLVVVGAGFFGATIAERAAAEGYRVAVLDRRDHIGGNAYSYVDQATGIEVHKYGPHIFHTNSREVVDYLSRFTSWVPYEHRVWTTSGGRVFPMPINLATICLFLGRVVSPAAARAWVAEHAGGFAEPANLEEKAISLIGRPLYEAFIRDYTRKQWQEDPGTCRPRSSRGCRCATISTTVTSATRISRCRSTGTPRSSSGCWRGLV